VIVVVLDHPGRLGCPKAVGNDGLDSVIPMSPKGFHCFFRKRDLSLSGSHYAPSRRAVKCHVSEVGLRAPSPAVLKGKEGESPCAGVSLPLNEQERR
jgi:hypothetical protein